MGVKVLRIMEILAASLAPPVKGEGIVFFDTVALKTRQDLAPARIGTVQHARSRGVERGPDC